MSVRPRQLPELPACVEALAAVHEEDGYPTRWPHDPTGWLTPPALIAAWVSAEGAALQAHLALVAGVEDDQLGRLVGRPASEVASVSRLFVRPIDRRRGLGESLLRTAMAYAAERELALVLDVVDEGRSAAVRLYERLGWQLTGLRAATWLTPSGDRPRLRLYMLPNPQPPVLVRPG